MDTVEITGHLQAIRNDLNSFFYQFQRARERAEGPKDASQVTEHFVAMRDVALNVLKPHNFDIPTDAYSDIVNLLTLYMMGSIGRYGFITYLSGQHYSKRPEGNGLNNLVLIEIIEEADKYLPGYKETSNAR